MYITGTRTACGTILDLSNRLAAISADVFLLGESCGREVVVTYRDISTTVTVVDVCNACPAESLELTPVRTSRTRRDEQSWCTDSS